MLQNSGYLATQPDVVDTSVLSYEFGGTNTPASAFIIESRYVDATGGGEGVVTLRDADFNFVWVDFQNPLSPSGTGAIQPTLTISKKGGNSVEISWSGGAGYRLESSPTLGANPVWTDLGTQNPQTVPTTGDAQFFRAIKP
jgi:hypothetical protein